MTALKGKAIEAFVARRDPSIAAVLIYGPDNGLVRDRATRLAKTVVNDLNDPFNAIEFTDADLKAEPAKLVDEACALSFMGGERLIRVRSQGEGTSEALKLLVSALDGGSIAANGLTVVEAGDLAKSSAIRKLFEQSNKVVALPCYADAPQDVRALAQSVAADNGLRFSPEALDFACAQLGTGDRGISLSELEKLMLFVGPADGDGPEREISLDDASAVLNDPVNQAGDNIAHLASDGDMKGLSEALYRSSLAGVSSISILRVLQRQILRLSTAAGHMATGDSPQAAMKKLRPPVFFMEQKRFERQLVRWTENKLARASQLLLEAELAAKTTGAPQNEIVERAAFRLASLAR